jgi:hypoxanthine phosphoribosyltransferase
MNKLYNEEQLQQAVKKVSKEIKKHIDKDREPFDVNKRKPPVFICVLNGAFMFFTDLVKEMNPFDIEIDFIRAKSYQNQNQFEVKIIKDIETYITVKDIYLIDDILDSGKTMVVLMDHLGKHHKPHSITPVVLFKKQHQTWPIIHGIELTDETWICGYGLDGENGLYRNKKDIFGKLEEID